MDKKQKLAELRREIAEKYSGRESLVAEIETLRDAEAPDEAAIKAKIAERKALDTDLNNLDARAAELEAEILEDEVAERRAAAIRQVVDTDTGNEREERVTARDKGTYNPSFDRRGKHFMRDVATAALGNREAQQRLDQHMVEMRSQLEDHQRAYLERAVGTSAFAGVAIPTYLTDMVGPHAKAGAPFVSVMNRHELPETGTKVVLSEVTTGTAVANHTEAGSIQVTDIDDTLIEADVRAAVGGQVLSHKVIDRAPEALDITLEDLYRAYRTNIGSTVINLATYGLSAIANAVTYTDATPTVGEIYPKIFQALAGVESAMLDQDEDDVLIVMHGRRWRWFQAALVSTWPLIAGKNVPAQAAGISEEKPYGDAVRGYFPSGNGVIVDNNVPVTKGSGTDEDEIYVINRSECHIWLPPDDAPMLLKAEKISTNQVELAVYGYYAFTFQRKAGAKQKIAGTGLVAPTFA